MRDLKLLVIKHMFMIKVIRALLGEVLIFKNREAIEFIRTKKIKENDSISERGLPFQDVYFFSGHYKTMLLRYLFAANFFCKDNDVLETCCGLGWGAYLVSEQAKKVVAFDLDKTALDFCRKEWNADNVMWIEGNALDFSFLDGKKFDVVLAMETIEHFKKEDGEKYINNISLVLKNDGVLIGTSAFPTTRDEADKLASKNIHHPYIWTEKEMKVLLSKYFKNYVIINRWMFIAKK